MDKMPWMWRKDKGKDKENYNNERFSIVLPSLQERVYGWRRRFWSYSNKEKRLTL